MKKQLDAYHNQCGISDSTPIKAVSDGVNPSMGVPEARAASTARTQLVDAARKARALLEEYE